MNSGVSSQGDFISPRRSTIKSPRSTGGKTLRNFEGFLKNYSAIFSQPLDQIWLEFTFDQDGQLNKEKSRLFIAEVCKVIDGDRASNYDDSKFDELFD
jgi:hypothetical protein